MRILGACIFSKFFGGKIENFKQTLLTETFSIKIKCTGDGENLN